MKKLFGTDGIRGVAGQPPLDPPTIHAVGLALAHHLGRDPRDQPPRVLIGQDTRESSDWIAATLAAGLAAAGATVESAGVITTPAVAFLARAHSFAAGIVISASHNPWQDNGIKLFGPDGYKLPDATELAIETEIFRHLGAPGLDSETWDRTTAEPPPINQADRAEYIRFLLTAVPGLSLDGRRLVVDCANGAASAIAPQLFAELNSNGGGEVLLTHASPNGRNINEHCGALHPEIVAAEGCAGGEHLFEDVLVADGGAEHLDLGALERGFEAHVGHGGGDDGSIGEQAVGGEVAGGQQKDSIAVDDFAVLIGEEGAVGVAVEGEADACAAGLDGGGDDLRVQGAAVEVDVASVG